MTLDNTAVLDKLRAGEVLVSDGATGTFLQQNGLEPGGDPEEFNMQKGNLSDIQISTKQQAIESFVNVLNGTSNKTMKEITILNAAGGMIVGGLCDKFKDGVELARETINSGKAFNKLKQFAKENNTQEKLEEVN